MAINVPMNEVKKVVYKSDELNVLNIAGCTWKKPYTLTVSVENPKYIGHLNLTRAIQNTVVNEAEAAGWNDEALSGSTSYAYPILYEDKIEIYAEGKYVDGHLCCIAPQMGASGAITSKEFTGDQESSFGRFVALGDCTINLGGIEPDAYTLTISKGTGVKSVSVSRYSSLIAPTGNLSTGATVYAGDRLNIIAYASSGYMLDSYATTVTVSGNTVVHVTATAIPREWRTIYNGSRTIASAFSKADYANSRSKANTLTEDDFGISLSVDYPIRISGRISGTHVDESFESTFTNVELCNLGEPAVLGTYNSGGTNYYIYETVAYADCQDPEIDPSWAINVTRYISRRSSLSNSWSADFPAVTITKIDAYMPIATPGDPGSSQTLTLSSGAEVVVSTGVDSAGNDWYWYDVSSDLDIHCVCRGSHWGYDQVPLQYGPGYTNDPIDIYEFDGYNSSEMADAAGNPSLEAQIVEEYGVYLGSIQLIDGYWYVV